MICDLFDSFNKLVKYTFFLTSLKAQVNPSCILLNRTEPRINLDSDESVVNTHFTLNNASVKNTFDSYMSYVSALPMMSYHKFTMKLAQHHTGIHLDNTLACSFKPRDSEEDGCRTH